MTRTIKETLSDAIARLADLNRYVEGLEQGAFPLYEVEEFIEDDIGALYSDLLKVLKKVG